LLRLAPWVTLSGYLDSTLMTRDPEQQREHQTDPLRHSRISPPFFFGMKAAAERVIERAGAITLPVLMLLGGSDPVIDAGTSEGVFGCLGSTDKALRVYPEMLHEPLNELGRDAVFSDMDAWLKERIRDEG